MFHNFGQQVIFLIELSSLYVVCKMLLAIQKTDNYFRILFQNGHAGHPVPRADQYFQQCQVIRQKLGQKQQFKVAQNESTERIPNSALKYGFPQDK